MTIKPVFTDQADPVSAAQHFLLQGLPVGTEITAPYNAHEQDAPQCWSIRHEQDGLDTITCDFTYDPDERRIKVDSIIIHEDLGQNGLGRQIIRNIADFTKENYPQITSIEADAGEDYGGIAWASWGFYHDANSGVREQAQERLTHLQSLMTPEHYQEVSAILADNSDKAALTRIARMKDDIGGYPLNLLLLGETDGHVSLDLNDPVQMAIFAPSGSAPQQKASSSHAARPNVRDALEMFGLD